MSDKYNALDNIGAAKKLREQLQLETQDINSGISYDAATSWCGDCPLGDGHGGDDLPYLDEFGFEIHYAPTCCKDNGTFEEQYSDSFKKTEQISQLITLLTAYIGEQESEAHS